MAIQDVVIIGGGAAGIACAASLLRRKSHLTITIIEPSATHHYQPGWTMVGAGIFNPRQTQRPMAALIPNSVTWIQDEALGFDIAGQSVSLCNGRAIGFRTLIIATGLKLDWDAIPGLVDTLGKNGVTSNYRSDLAPYTWRLVQDMRSGTALFTQPPMPIKCAGAPQKALYLSCDYWQRQGRLSQIDTAFFTSAPSLFGVAEYIPALMEHINCYSVDLRLRSTLVSVNGAERTATIETTDPNGEKTFIDRRFDFLHVVPPQISPDVIRNSAFADASGFVAVSPSTLQSTIAHNVFALGDVIATTNAKTAAAVRKQAPIVASNVLAVLSGATPTEHYDGYGSCPLTVRRGRIVLAEFGYGGVLLPTFPRWMLDGTRPSYLAWMLKRYVLPPLYWHAMLRGREWLTQPPHT